MARRRAGQSRAPAAPSADASPGTPIGDTPAAPGVQTTVGESSAGAFPGAYHAVQVWTGAAGATAATRGVPPAPAPRDDARDEDDQHEPDDPADHERPAAAGVGCHGDRRGREGGEARGLVIAAGLPRVPRLLEIGVGRLARQPELGQPVPRRRHGRRGARQRLERRLRRRLLGPDVPGSR